MIDLGIFEFVVVLFLLYINYKINIKYVGLHLLFSVAGVGIILVDFSTLSDLFLSDGSALVFYGVVICVFFAIPAYKVLLYVEKLK